MKTLYLVTGGCGFLGSHVVRKLTESGKAVRVLALNGDKSVKYLPEGTEIFYGDLCDYESVNKFFTVEKDTETICLHIASMVTVNPDYSEKLMAINVGGTENMCKAMLNHPECKKMVYVSSTGAIPELPKGIRIYETEDFDKDKVIGWYSKTKALATLTVLKYVHDYNLDISVVHPAGILGPVDYAVGETTGTIIKIMNGEMPVGMQGSFNLCDVRDLADGVISAASKGKKGECYILANKCVTLKELVKLLKKDTGCKGPKFYLPLWMAKIIARKMEKKAKKNHTKPLMTEFSVYNLERNNEYDYSKAEKELGYKTRPYSETLHDEAIWLKQEGFIQA